jgi:hypothetical protein
MVFEWPAYPAPFPLVSAGKAAGRLCTLRASGVENLSQHFMCNCTLLLCLHASIFPTTLAHDGFCMTCTLL